MKNHFKFAFILFATFLCSSCSGDNKSSFGLKKPAPDEFVVISNQPLSMPPELAGYNGDEKDPNAGTGFRPANKSIHLKENHRNQPMLSNEDERFLHSLGIDSHEKSHVKKEIDKELSHKQNKIENQNTVSQTISKIRGDQVEHVIDPIKEKERLSQNLKDGKPINEGEVSNKSDSTLKRLFD